MTGPRKKVIRLSIVMSVDIYGLDDHDAENYLVDSHCTSNHFVAIAERIAAHPNICNECRFATVEVLPDDTEAYDPSTRPH